MATEVIDKLFRLTAGELEVLVISRRNAGHPTSAASVTFRSAVCALAAVANKTSPAIITLQSFAIDIVCALVVNRFMRRPRIVVNFRHRQPAPAQCRSAPGNQSERSNQSAIPEEPSRITLQEVLHGFSCHRRVRR